MSAGKRTSVLLVGAALLVFGQALASEREFGRCYGLRVGAADAPEDSLRRRGRAPALSAAEVKDIAIEISVPEDAAGRPVRVKLFTPRGPLYQVLDAVADGASDEGQGRRRRSRRRGHTLVARFPVAGTPVTAHALFGTWRAEVYLDDAEKPCARPIEFVLER